MKKLFYVFCFISSLLIITGCGVKQGYIGNALPKTEVAVIRGKKNVTHIKGKKQHEKVWIIKVDSLDVGNAYLGWPKYVNVIPGRRSIEVRHWVDSEVDLSSIKSGSSGGVGLIGAMTLFEDNNTHYILTFDVLKGKQYSIFIKTHEENIDKPEIYVIEKTSGEKVAVEVVQNTIK